MSTRRKEKLSRAGKFKVTILKSKELSDRLCVLVYMWRDVSMILYWVIWKHWRMKREHLWAAKVLEGLFPFLSSCPTALVIATSVQVPRCVRLGATLLILPIIRAFQLVCSLGLWFELRSGFLFPKHILITTLSSALLIRAGEELWAWEQG